MSKKNSPQGPDSVPFLMKQPIQGDMPDSMELVNRYGTYEIQPTADSQNFFPTIAQGTYDKTALGSLRRESRIQTDPEDKRNG